MAVNELTTIIDWDFIVDSEATKLHGYVPKNKDKKVIGKSGVTIATGFDLGSKSAHFLTEHLSLPLPLVNKLSPYFLLTQEAAVKELEAHPLEITQEEADLIDNQMRYYTLKQLVRDWYRFSFIPFYTLDKRVKTVLFSLAYNFGSIRQLPKTMEVAADCAKRNSWEKLYTTLKNFPSKNPELKKRREKEANYLRPLFEPVGSSTV